MLGPNGAGKTTTVTVLMTLMGADGGTVSAYPAWRGPATRCDKTPNSHMAVLQLR